MQSNILQPHEIVAQYEIIVNAAMNLLERKIESAIKRFEKEYGVFITVDRCSNVDRRYGAKRLSLSKHSEITSFHNKGIIYLGLDSSVYKPLPLS